MMTREYCYTSLCGHGEVRPKEQAKDTLSICGILRTAIAEAGGSGFLEESPCPHVLINKLGISEEDTISQAFKKMDLSHQLGLGVSSALEGLE